LAWLGGSSAVAVLSFDVDAESPILAMGRRYADHAMVMTHQAYGPLVGVPRLLDLLGEYGLPATFFVPGLTAERYPSVVERIAAAGHEVGHHSYLHKWIDPGDPEGELEEMEKGLEALKRTVGVKPVGYRSPAGETSPNLFKLLVERDFLYESSMMDGINPYFHEIGGNKRALVELPWHWSLDDAVYMIFSIKAPRAIMTNSHILEIWQDEFRAIYKAGGFFDLVMHPQAIGRPSRLELLRSFIAFAQSFPNVWFCTGRDAAKAFAEQAP
jgi:peptidoglycan/xylan/chitin deacetylase (PgdA/CDA1 family)